MTFADWRTLARGRAIAEPISLKVGFVDFRRELALIRRAQARIGDLSGGAGTALEHRAAAAALLDADGAESELAWELAELHEQIADALVARAAASRASAAGDRASAIRHYATRRDLWSALDRRGSLPDADRGRAERVAAREARVAAAPAAIAR